MKLLKIGTNRIRAPKYDMVVLSRTKYEVVPGRTEYDYFKKARGRTTGTVPV